MLIFQPAFEPFHAIFRLLRLLLIISEIGPVDYEKVRILDFYLTFPFRTESISFKRGQTGLRKVARNYEKFHPYGGLPDDRELFRRMAPTQILAAETLASRSILDPDAFKKGFVLSGEEGAPKELITRLLELNDEQSDLMDLLHILCTDYPLLGPDGLKQRTSLLEHRYDAV